MLKRPFLLKSFKLRSSLCFFPQYFLSKYQKAINEAKNAWMDFKITYSNENAIKTAKDETFLQIKTSHISPSIYQLGRFHMKKINNEEYLILFQNNFRKEMIAKAMTFINQPDNEKPIKIVGSRGLGKSHFMALLLTHMKLDMILQKPVKRILYINDPSNYTIRLSEFFMKDVAYFLGPDLCGERRKQVRRRIL